MITCVNVSILTKVRNHRFRAKVCHQIVFRRKCIRGSNPRAEMNPPGRMFSVVLRSIIGSQRSDSLEKASSISRYQERNLSKFFLTRCRSACRRSSSLSSRDCKSPEHWCYYGSSLRDIVLGDEMLSYAMDSAHVGGSPKAKRAQMAGRMLHQSWMFSQYHHIAMLTFLWEDSSEIVISSHSQRQMMLLHVQSER
jgi:hypothetical protein